MTNDPQIVVRLTGGEETRLSASLPFSEALKAAQARLGVDKVYIVLEGEGGFSLKEAGALVVSFVPFDELASASPPPPIPGGKNLQELIPSENSAAPMPTPSLEAKNEPSESQEAKQPKVRKARIKKEGSHKGKVVMEGIIPATAESLESADMFGKISTR